MDELEFIKYVNMVIEGCGCKAIKIDLDTKNINVDCPPDKEIECAQALEEALGKYCVE